MKRLIAIFLLSVALAGFHALPANAQATRTFVSGVGDDANPCSRTAPCKTFAGAIAKTVSSGEIDCLDPGGFGALTITIAITILCDGVSNGGVLVAGTNGITVATGAGVVVLSGLDFEGLSPGSGSPGLVGVSVLAGGPVIIRNSIIRDFSTAGISLAATAANAAVLIENTHIIHNQVGLNVQSTGSIVNFAELDNSFIVGLNGADIQVNGAVASVQMSGSILTRGAGDSGAAISVSGGGTVVSNGNNVIRGTGTPTSTSPLQ